MVLLRGGLADGNDTFRLPGSDLISFEAYGIDRSTRLKTEPGPSHRRSLGWE